MTIFNAAQQSTLGRIASGDQTAAQDCLQRYGKLIWYLAKKYTNTMEDAEDAVQEIFLDLWQHAARFNPEKASESTFIALIARRRLIDRLRKSSRRPHIQTLEEISLSAKRNSEHQMQIALDAERAAKIIDQLRAEQKQVINLAIFSGLTHSEIAEQTGLPLGTVKTLIRRGLQKVRAAFGVSEKEAAAA